MKAKAWILFEMKIGAVVQAALALNRRALEKQNTRIETARMGCTTLGRLNPDTIRRPIFNWLSAPAVEKTELGFS